VVEDGVDDAGVVEADHDGQPPGHGRGLEPADLLQPAHKQLDVGPPDRERIEAAVGVPAQEHVQVGLGVVAG
jgi:hypothetical protein